MGIRRWLLVLNLSAALFTSTESAVAQGPNFLFLLVDDLGWRDLGCYGSPAHETPHIDELCRQGVKFTQAYTAASICSPTRASILTGKHPVRVDITDWIPGQRPGNQKLRTPEDRHELALEEITIAEALKKGGYQTFYAGKWHLGGDDHGPAEQGFEVTISDYGNFRKDPLVSDRLTRAAVHFLKTRDSDRPFFLYLSYHKVHTPILAYPKHIERFRKKFKSDDKSAPIPEHEGVTRSRQDNAAYASMVAAVDDSVGRLLEVLDELKLSERTVVFFFSDNGGLSTKKTVGPTCNLPLRAGKGWLYEGGIRVPLIVRAPGITRAGLVCDDPIVSMDLYPTILELASLSAMKEQHRDGISIVPLLKGSTKWRRQTLYWHYPHYHGSTWKPGAAIRDGDWKLIEFHHYDKIELYDLKADPGEKNDLSKKNPTRTEQLLRKLHSWQKKLDAKLPRP